MPQKPTRTTSRRAQAAQKAAADLIQFCDGLEQAGLDTYAHRARNVARETIWLAQQLDIEHGARVEIQRQRDQLRDLWQHRHEPERAA